MVEEINGIVNVNVGLVLLLKVYLFVGVNYENNVVFVIGVVVGEIMFYGFGVGELLIVISVVSDLIIVVKNSCFGMNGNVFNSYKYEIKYILKE